MNNHLATTGKGLKIAVIDSGFTDHDHIRGDQVYGGIGVTSSEDGPILSDDYRDWHGHGTGVVGILANRLPDAQFYIVKILDQNNSSTGQALLKGLELAMDEDVDIIHMSLGTTDQRCRDHLERLCTKAIRKNQYLVGAASPGFQVGYPADLPQVIKVYGGVIFSNRKFFYRENDFIAQGVPQLTPTLNSSYVMRPGSSFAAPHITALLTSLIEKHGKKPFPEMLELLKQQSHSVKNQNIMDLSHMQILRRVPVTNTDLFEIVYEACNIFFAVPHRNAILWGLDLTPDNAHLILEKVEDQLGTKLNYLEFSFYDFCNIATLTQAVEMQLRD